MIFEFYEQKYLENLYLKLNFAQSTKQERSFFFTYNTCVLISSVRHLREFDAKLLFNG